MRILNSDNMIAKRYRRKAYLLNKATANSAILFLLSILASGCFSKQNLWVPSDKSQNYRLVTSFSGEIAAAVSKHHDANLRMSIFDSLQNNLYKGDIFLALDSQLVLSSGEDSVIIYERKYTSNCSDGRGVYTHKLLLSKRDQVYLSDKSVYLHYGCEYGAEIMKIERVKETDSSLIVYGFMSEKSKDYPIWIEVIQLQ